MPLIETHGLTKLYRMGTSIVRALDGVDVSIERGDFVAITGASGSGKSTMMHLLGCLDRPTAGRYLLDGRDVSDLSDRQLAAIRNRQIGFVFQTFNLINRTTALENVIVPQFYARRANTRAAALRALERVGLAQRAHHNPNELSGGERQRVAIARAIVNDPAVLLADEPTGNLDSKTGAQILGIFRDLSAQGVTIVIVTHEPSIARQARRVILMRDGKIVADQPAGPASPQGSQALEASEPALAAESVPVAATAASLDVAAAPVAESVATGARRVRGAIAGLTCSLVAVALLALALVVQQVVMRVYPVPTFDPARPQLPPLPVMLAGLGVLAGLLSGLVLGIVGVAVSAGARRRLRMEPGYWTGARHVTAGLVLGGLAIVAAVGIPLAGIVAGLVLRKPG